jgi:outer membrane receptor protein involved in Fe transport
VRRFPPVEVWAPLHDLRSSQTLHVLAGDGLRALPVDGLAGALALQPGVVAQAEELHVRGGRAGELAVSLDGLALNEPLRRRPMDVPLLALRGADLVSGAPEASFGGGLAGVLDLHTLDPGSRPSAEWRWQTDGRLGAHYDRVATRIATPLGVLGLGALAAGEATLDDTSLPALRTESRREVAGMSFGWRAENRMLGYLKLAPVREPRRLSAQVVASRQVLRPFDPQWSLDGWTLLPVNPKASPIWSPVPLPGYLRYRAADHLAMTDERNLAVLLSASAARGAGRGTLGLGWLRTRSVTSIGGGYESGDVVHRPAYNNLLEGERFHVLWGDYPLYRESASDVLSLRGDLEVATRGGGWIKAGSGLTYDDVSLREIDWMPIGWGWAPGTENNTIPLDSLRAYRAYAPGGFAYAQGRWQSGGLVLNAGLRAEYFTAGPQAAHQTLPWTSRGVWSLAPRLGIAYPISVRDAFSLAYVRVQQPPGRDFLYDRRQVIGGRQPLGNPALQPATMISYEASVKHVFGPSLALQTSVFYRDVYGQVGARDRTTPGGPVDLRYADEDEGEVVGFEWSVIHREGERRWLEAHYTWMQAWGSESRPEGDPYGPLRATRTAPIGSQPLSWDRRHALTAAGAVRWRERWSLAWSTAVESPLPWTPKPLRAPLTDLSVVNSRRLGWMESTNLDLRWSPPGALGLTFGIEARNLFDHRGERAATLDGYPNPVVNTRYDDYGAYRTATGLGGGAYWLEGADGAPGQWVPVHDPRLMQPPRTIRASVGARW